MRNLKSLDQTQDPSPHFAAVANRIVPGLSGRLCVKLPGNETVLISNGIDGVVSEIAVHKPGFFQRARAACQVDSCAATVVSGNWETQLTVERPA